jgi:class 3 adenylate cyclase
MLLEDAEESSGEPGRIQISASTRQRLNDHYELDDRRTIEVKGKGPMATYFVLGRREGGG